MRSKKFVAFLGICAVWGHPAFAADYLPADQTVILYLRAVPDDPESEIKTVIKIDLTAIDRTAGSVGWQVQRMSFSRRLSDNSEAAWEILLPEVLSIDGLWWVDHVDTTKPITAEFSLVPWILGTAQSLDGRYSHLEFDIVGAPATVQDPQPGNGHSARLSYSLAADGPTEPVNDDNDDEPVEIPDGASDPLMQ